MLKSLAKMYAKVQANPDTPPHAIYHRGLIKILICHWLKELNRSWDYFMFLGGLKFESAH